AALTTTGRPFELVFVDDGSTDDTAAACESAADVRLVQHARNAGQSAATITGIRAARGQTIVTLDGDGQNDPASIPALLEALTGHDVALGFREKRNDSWSRRAASRLAFCVRNLVLRDGVRDIGCSLRAFPREAALDLPSFDGLHRLMPAIFVFLGLKTVQVPTNHRPRTAGVSKYGNVRRGLRGLFDLIGLLWLRRRILARTPLLRAHETSPRNTAEEPCEQAR
ncbi:MAG: glycosyltransferase, partial [Planctomycetota bacterium]